MLLSNVSAFLVIFGLPTLFVVTWVGFWVFLGRVPVWFLVVGGGVSTAFIVLAWTLSKGGDASGAPGSRGVIGFYGLFLNGIIGLLCIVMLTMATVAVEWMRLGIRQRSSHQPTPKGTGGAAHQT